MRQCAKCGHAISRSWGAVKAGDFLEFIETKRKDMRELCNICQYLWQWDENANLVPNETFTQLNESKVRDLK